METSMYRICPAAEIYQTQGKADEFSVVAVLPSHVEAEETVKKLKSSGIDLKNCSIVGKENPSGEHVIGYYTIGSRIAFWGKMGAFWGGLWGLLSASAFFLIPGIGPVVVGGTFVSAIVGALEGAVVVGGLSALGSAFYYIGVPTKTIVDYETAVKEDCFIVIVHGNSDDVAKAKLVLESSSQSEKSNAA